MDSFTYKEAYEEMKLRENKYKRKYERAKELLIDIEWIYVNGENICLFCKGTKELDHTENCELAKELGDE